MSALACQTVAASVATTWPAHLAAQANSVVRANLAVEKLHRTPPRSSTWCCGPIGGWRR